jgi:hypothetical protein
VAATCPNRHNDSTVLTAQWWDGCLLVRLPHQAQPLQC